MKHELLNSAASTDMFFWRQLRWTGDRVRSGKTISVFPCVSQHVPGLTADNNETTGVHRRCTEIRSVLKQGQFRTAFYWVHIAIQCRSQWPRGLRRRSAAARLLRSWVRNSPGGMNVCLLWVLCFVRYRSLRRANHSSREDLPTVVRHFVWSRNLKKEGAMTRVGSQRHRNK